MGLTLVANTLNRSAMSLLYLRSRTQRSAYIRKGRMPMAIHPDRMAIDGLPIILLGQKYGRTVNVNAVEGHQPGEAIHLARPCEDIPVKNASIPKTIAMALSGGE